jgi:ribose-phosphate pyrophosphokinase
MITFKARDESGEIINSGLQEFTFPAGEKHIKQNSRPVQPVEIAIFQPDAATMHDDLFTLAMWADNLVPTHPTTKSVLIMPYVPGARADRGLPFGLGIYGGFINELEIDQIIIFDPHSQATPELLKGFENLTVVYSDELFAQKHMTPVLHGYDGIIAPDKGAVLRATAVAELAGLPVHTAEKTRDFETGKLTGFKLDGLSKHGNYLIVDDICDGGGTFLGLAEEIGLDYGQLDLFVSHGVFSKDALKNLAQVFGYVFTTNSYNPRRDLNAALDYEKFRRFDVIRLLESKILDYTL